MLQVHVFCKRGTTVSGHPCRCTVLCRTVLCCAVTVACMAVYGRAQPCHPHSVNFSVLGLLHCTALCCTAYRNGSQLVKDVREKKDKSHTALYCTVLQPDVDHHTDCTAPCCTMLCFAACRNGSQLVKEVREKKDKDKSRLRFWDMAGSKMGQITGLTNDEQGEAQKRAEEQVRLDVGTSNGTLRIGRR